MGDRKNAKGNLKLKNWTPLSFNIGHWLADLKSKFEKQHIDLIQRACLIFLICICSPVSFQHSNKRCLGSTNFNYVVNEFEYY